MAKQTRKKKSPSKAQSSKRWPWLTIGILSGFAAASYLAHVNMLPDFFQQKQQTAKQTSPSPSPKKVVKKAPQFDFYNMLQADKKDPSPQKPIAKTANTPKTIPAPVVKKSQPEAKVPIEKIFLQAAAFRHAKDADQLKAQLILAGYNVQVTKVTKNKTDWHRVLVGPFTNKPQAEITKEKLAKQHIKSHTISSG